MVPTKRSLILYYLSSRIITRGAPLISIGFIYGFLEEVPETTKLEGMFTFALIFLLFTFYKDLKQVTSTFLESKWDDLTEEGKWVVVTGALLLFVQWAKMGLGNIEILLIVIFLSQLVAIYPAYKYSVGLRILGEQKKKEKSEM